MASSLPPGPFLSSTSIADMAATRAAAGAAFTTAPSAVDPHRYQTGFGNRFASEAVPGVLPVGRNVPQKLKYGLYSEQLNGAAVVSPRDAIQHVWMYRVRPSVAHGRVAADNQNPHIESCFSRANDKVEFVAAQQAWDPFPLLAPHQEAAGAPAVDFVAGIRTVAGQGDPALRQGLAVHVYSANVSMTNRAFCNNDGDLLILPQHGRLHVQTELGWLMVRPGELFVVQAGIRFRVLLPDGPSRGYIQEIFGTHYRLPELGPVGSNGMALPRDFESPIASFDVDETPWHITYKLAGTLHSCRQGHTPFDVVAWHGNLAPYKYALDRFVNLANANHDQADPTVYCVLTAGPTSAPSLTDVLIFTKKWLTAEDTFRPPYYHRNMSTEVMGLVHGRYGGSSHVLEGGGLSYEASYMPHGETYSTWREASTRELRSELVCEDAMAFMFHIGAPLYLTHWALRGDGAASLNASDETQWDDVQAHFLDHLDEVDADLRAAGLPALRDGRGELN
ncbi:homogentisate 1,2-dioxygenase [Purpureocillium lavendulum]|uniref:homogentisate 1,2-dioxygenase n=1 Tax=Purpureocillium lavendulum TaxID=1247861 RepID=A0AB34FXR6_9HYPO|nr:homogentisate 1,2-dioxygenase [Purpureocillium lavendulum]